MNATNIHTRTAVPSTPSPSAPSSTTANTQQGFSLDNFEAQITSLINSTMQAAGVSPSEASFSFSPTTANATSNATPSSTANTPASNDVILNPMSGAILKTISQNTVTPNSSQPSDPTAANNASDTTAAGENVYNPFSGQFDGVFGKTQVSNPNDLWVNPISGETKPADLIIAGYEKVYGDDKANMMNSIMTHWGQTAYRDYLAKNPDVAAMNINPVLDGKPATSFEKYGAFNSFTDPSMGGKSAYFDADGKEYLSGTGPAMKLYTVTGQLISNLHKNTQNT